MRCREARALLQRAADGELALEDRLALDAHVAECERCAPLARRLEELEHAFARFPEPPVDSLDLDAQVRAVRARIAGDARTERTRRFTLSLDARRALVAAAVLALVAAGLVLFLRGAAAPTPPVVQEPPRSPSVAPRDAVDAPKDARADVAAPELAHDGSSVQRARARRGRCAARARAGTAARRRRGRRRRRSAPSNAPSAEPEPSTPVAAAPNDAAPSSSVVETAPTPEELARIEATRARLAAVLVDAFAHAAPDRAALKRAFALATAELAREPWPLARLAEGLALGGDEPTARAALRYVGLFGDAGSARTLARAAERPAFTADAALALADLDEPALEPLSELVRDPGQRERVLDRLAARRDDAGTRTLEALTRRSVRGESALPSVHDEDARRLRARCVFALARSGPAALTSLLRLGTDGVVSTSDALAAARTVEDAPATLAALLHAGARGLDPRLTIAAVRDLRPAGGVEWLDERAKGSRELREDALDALGAFDDVDAALALLRWHASGRLSDARTSALFDGVLLRRPETGAELARALTTRRDRAALHELDELLVQHPDTADVPALIELAGTDLLVRGDRRTALQLVAELGDADARPRLEALWTRLEETERELRAACLIALHRFGGRDAVLALFPNAPQRALDRLIAVCDDAEERARPTTTMFRVLQELDALGSRTTP